MEVVLLDHGKIVDEYMSKCSVEMNAPWHLSYLDNYKLNVQMDGFYIYNSLYTAQTIMDKAI